MAKATATFDGGLASVGDARHFVQRVLIGWGAGACGAEASLLVTELATNSVIHAQTAFTVTVTLDERGLRLSVSDGSPRLPHSKSYSLRATTGRGLRLVAAYSQSWGVEPRRRGKTVWCTLRFDGARGTPEAGQARARSA